MPNWFNTENLRITTKVSLIVTLLAAVSLGATGYSALRLQAVDSAYSDLISRVEVGATQSARANRMIVTYLPRPLSWSWKQRMRNVSLAGSADEY